MSRRYDFRLHTRAAVRRPRESGVLTVGSLFSGIEGIGLGLERAGMRVVWQCEWDSAARQVLRSHYPDIPCYADVRDIPVGDLVVPDLLAGGFPCQPTSFTGAKLGREDERWRWPDFARLVGLLRPRYVLVENPPGLLRREFGDVLGDLAGLGYDAEWESVPAFAVGAPHERDRVFLVAYPERRRLQGGVFERVQPPAELTAARRRSRYGRSVGATWSAEPDVDLLAHGLPPGLAEAAIRVLGNAVVPQVAEYVGRQIIAHAEGEARMTAALLGSPIVESLR